MEDILTIIIPCKNEEKYISNLLDSLIEQSLVNCKILIADANSTDCTLSIINGYRKSLNIEVIEGGLPAIARNNGAKLAKTPYILFIDADGIIKDPNLIVKSMSKMLIFDYDIVTCKLNSSYIIVKFLYKINNIITLLSKFEKPFVTGMFFLTKREKFLELGGFPEDVMHCEDYLLSKKYDRKKFGIVNSSIYSDNRRFKKMGYFGMVKYIFNNIKNRNNDDYFKKEINYWK